MILLLQLLIAHLIGDFFTQTRLLVYKKEQQKWRSAFLYVHVLIHFVLMMLITADPAFWKYALAITLLHLVIDGCKLQFQKEETRRTWFVADQLLHLLVIIVAWALYQQMPLDLSLLSDKRVLAVVFAMLFIMSPASFLIKVVISKWSPRSSPGKIMTEVESLENAGQLIGIMERFLIVIFILLNRWEGIGFLLGAKSIFRFGDLTEAKDTKLTEYVLIGTLLSFILAIMAGLVASYFLKA
ncbi:DUF3307 domain-containing protein [Flavitalea sp.]|nr:DUF3307 domain-containing protein [Flavitalea sp.]